MINLPNLFLALATSVGLSFSQAPAVMPVGEQFKLAINISSGGIETLGADAVILYDPKKTEVTKIGKGDVYLVYPPNLQDIDNSRGQAKFSGTASFKNPRAVNGVLGWVYFRAKKPGETTISLAWKPEGTADSNIVPVTGPIDLLTERPQNVTINFREASSEEKIFIFLKRIFSFDFLNF